MALKHRQGKNHRTRIIVFLGSPINFDEKELGKLARKLKKEKVNVDIICFGEEVIHLLSVISGSLLIWTSLVRMVELMYWQISSPLLTERRALVATWLQFLQVLAWKLCLLDCWPYFLFFEFIGPHLADALISSPIIQGEDGTGAVGLGAGGFEFVDPNEDPELALVNHFI